MFQLVFGMIALASLITIILFMFGVIYWVIDEMGIGATLIIGCFLITSYWLGGVII